MGYRRSLAVKCHGGLGELPIVQDVATGSRSGHGLDAIVLRTTKSVYGGGVMDGSSLRVMVHGGRWRIEIGLNGQGVCHLLVYYQMLLSPFATNNKFLPFPVQYRSRVVVRYGPGNFRYCVDITRNVFCATTLRHLLPPSREEGWVEGRLDYASASSWYMLMSKIGRVRLKKNYYRRILDEGIMEGSLKIGF
ncbi:hypothetical protein GOBAR_AA13393 [Gossypium barbadense]|uniref:Uncharacterized protein n=1 Tax=Gossypium barbadense TaxID=3634 RepID=A0A2P5XVA8_GOSBA|nr:hypothetical protein GOBAR_AA13393 [Gossypium barbadense]